MNPRGPAVDWYDYTGHRPVAFIRNGPMLNIGELGNIATGEYPWRTLYLQQPERPPHVTTGASDVTANHELMRGTLNCAGEEVYRLAWDGRAST